jgi:hypothetical protein
MYIRVYSPAVVAIDAFEAAIEVHSGWGNTDKVAMDPRSPNKSRGNKTMSVKEIRQLRTQIMMTALTLSIRSDQTLVKAVDSIPPGPSGKSKARQSWNHLARPSISFQRLRAEGAVLTVRSEIGPYRRPSRKSLWPQLNEPAPPIWPQLKQAAADNS